MPSPTALVVDGDHYFYVSMGPKPTIEGQPTPKWHPLAEPVRYPFPTLRSAAVFAKVHKRIDPAREVAIDYPDGRRWDGRQFI